MTGIESSCGDEEWYCKIFLIRLSAFNETNLLCRLSLSAKSCESKKFVITSIRDSKKEENELRRSSKWQKIIQMV